MKGDLQGAIDRIVSNSISAGAMPGCQILVAKDGQIVIDKSYGTLDYPKGSPSVNEESLYDLASMSKVCGTLAALMKTYDKGLWKLNDKVEDFIPQTRDTRVGAITMEELLYHQSGLPAMINVFKVVLDTATYKGEPIKFASAPPYTVKISNGVYGHKDARLRTDIFSNERSDKYHLPVADGIWASDSARIAIMDAIYRLVPGQKKYVYSDLNFCLLMQIQEAITGERHDQWLLDNIFAPLNAYDTGYLPSTYYDMDNIAPTEKDSYLRKQHVKGYVHDETAAFSGGIQGNAGLFSNVDELARLFQTWLNGGEYGDARIYSDNTVRLFTGSKSPISDRGLGFDHLTRYKNWGVSPKTFGHTGFTGTCFWIDPEKNLIYIFLSNRVNPTRDNKAFTSTNPRYNVLKAVYESMK